MHLLREAIHNKPTLCRSLEVISNEMYILEKYSYFRTLINEVCDEEERVYTKTHGMY